MGGYDRDGTVAAEQETARPALDPDGEYSDGKVIFRITSRTGWELELVCSEQGEKGWKSLPSDRSNCVKIVEIIRGSDKSKAVLLDPRDWEASGCRASLKTRLWKQASPSPTNGLS